MALLQVGTGIKPQDAVDVLTRRMAQPLATFSWLDLFQHEHGRAFTVAKSAGFDILDDISKALDKALAEGQTFPEFAKQIAPVLQDKGWWGKKPVFDPETGRVVQAQLGSMRRLEVIYDTNMRMSYNAGRWVSFQRNKEDQPWLLYLHGGSKHPRLHHLAWDHVCLPADDVWWTTHMTPNGWGCSCNVVALSNRQKHQMERAGILKLERPALDPAEWPNPRTGEIVQVPKGIDPGFAYNPGQAFLTALAA
jgi:uncharacterized protein with gpF-like domain